MIKPTVWLALMASIIAGCTTTQQAQLGNTADVGSTVSALTFANAVEANPLALPMLPVRYFITREYRDAPCHNRRFVHSIQSGVGFGATANNLLVIAGAGFAPIAILLAVPAYIVTYKSKCELIPLMDAQTLLLAQWRKAYTEMDTTAVSRLLDNPEVAAQYATMFARLKRIEAEYANLSQSRKGFVADYEVTFHSKDGTFETRKGGVEFHVTEGTLTDIVG